MATITGGASGNGNGSVAFTIAANTGALAHRDIDGCRTNLHGDAGGAAAAVYVFDRAYQSVDYGERRQRNEYPRDDHCRLFVDRGEQRLVDFDQVGETGTGNGSVAFRVDANLAASASAR